MIAKVSSWFNADAYIQSQLNKSYSDICISCVVLYSADSRITLLKYEAKFHDAIKPCMSLITRGNCAQVKVCLEQ